MLAVLTNCDHFTGDKVTFINYSFKDFLLAGKLGKLPGDFGPQRVLSRVYNQYFCTNNRAQKFKTELGNKQAEEKNKRNVYTSIYRSILRCHQ